MDLPDGPAAPARCNSRVWCTWPSLGVRNGSSIRGGPLGAARRRHLPRLRRRQVPLRGLPSVPPRKQRHLDELQDATALLQRGNRDLAARAEAARGGLALALLANAALRAEAAALSRRLAAARRALVVLGRVYAGAAAVASVGYGNCCLGSRRRGWPRRAATARGCVERGRPRRRKVRWRLRQRGRRRRRGDGQWKKRKGDERRVPTAR
ncbi:unnamed protein product [Miscanthus lutarioriparius]|uniref:Uncharacterized protein n=1 Tax=Miscanthus lutarioriparius TaxID=422564 RepID=A0A811N458_9POAL|nr:unnamed protein product [Miscanthus lutarioriparius]